MSSEPRYAATRRRRAQARREGRVARSNVLVAGVTLVAGALAVVVGATGIVQRMAIFTRRSTTQAFEAPDVLPAVEGAFTLLGELLAPFLLCTLGAALLATYIQVGALVTTRTIAPDPARLRPRAPAFAASLWDACRGAVVLTAAMVGLWLAARTVLSVSRETLPGAIRRMAEVVGVVTPGILAAVLVVGVVDAVVVRVRYEKSLRMTRQERDDERRQTEGDPQVKARLRVFGDRAGSGTSAERAQGHATTGVSAATGEVEPGD